MSRAARGQPVRPEVYRITSANGSHSADLQQRAGRYLMSMGIRTVCVILVIIVPGPLRWVFAVGAIVLPYIAVVAANAGGERRQQPLPPPPPMARKNLSAAASSTVPGRPRTVDMETVEPETVEPETVEPETVEPQTVQPDRR